MKDQRATREIRIGDLVYYVTYRGGTVPVKVVGPADDPSMVRLRITADRSSWGYRRGEIFDGPRTATYTRDARFVSSGRYCWIEYRKVWKLEGEAR